VTIATAEILDGVLGPNGMPGSINRQEAVE
jgi:hypothetical protein